MSTPTLIKLTEPGSSLTLAVTSCALLKIGTYPEVEFTGTSANGLTTIRVPEKSADRQLGRAILTRETAVGRTLLFSRDPNASDPKKPYWGIVDVTGEPQATPTPKPQATAAGPGLESPAPTNGQSETPDPLPILYVKITKYVLEHVVPLYEAKEIGMTDAGVAAMCATLFIAATRSR